MIQCENEWCVYQENNRCVMQTVTLDIQGQCQECVYVSLDAEWLQQRKNEARQALEALRESR